MSSNSILGRLYTFCFYAFVFALPFQIDILVFSQNVYFTGFFNPYLSHFLYFSDVLLILSLFFLSLYLYLEKRHRRFVVGDRLLFFSLLLFGFSFLVSLLFSFDVINSLLYFLRFLEFLVVYLVLVNRLIDVRVLVSVFVFGMCFQSFLGIMQYVLQESLGLRVIGEPVVSSVSLGSAKVDIFSETFLRIYGSFSHPNIFAAHLIFALVLLPFSSLYSSLSGRRFSYIAIMLLIIAFLLTFSRSAYLALAFVFITFLLLFKRRGYLLRLVKFISSILILSFFLGFLKVVFLRLVYIDPSSLIERFRYISTSWDMFLAHPFGVGAGNFTLVMQNFDPVRLDPWLFQPVHNIYLLVLNELGVFGLISLFLVFSAYLRLLFTRSRRIRMALLSLLISVFVIGFFDHYLISLYQGQFLFWFMFWMAAL